MTNFTNPSLASVTEEITEDEKDGCSESVAIVAVQTKESEAALTDKQKITPRLTESHSQKEGQESRYRR